MALKIEENQKRRGEKNNRGRGSNFRGRGRFNVKGPFQRNQGEFNSQDLEGERNNRCNFRGRRSNSRGRFGGRGPSVFTGKCFT